MGDRSNIVIEDNYSEATQKPRVYLYAHWSGWDIAHSAVHGLKSGRATDGPYLARVIFSHMVKDDLTAETGYGISAQLTDNGHPIIVINPGTQEAWLENDDGGDLTAHVSFEDFIAAVEGSDGYDQLEQKLGPVPVPGEKEN
jgi:hypothetical protein